MLMELQHSLYDLSSDLLWHLWPRYTFLLKILLFLACQMLYSIALIPAYIKFLSCLGIFGWVRDFTKFSVPSTCIYNCHSERNLSHNSLAYWHPKNRCSCVSIPCWHCPHSIEGKCENLPILCRTGSFCCINNQAVRECLGMLTLFHTNFVQCGLLAAWVSQLYPCL